jgi:uncharacterized protein (DUF1330 family)
MPIYLNAQLTISDRETYGSYESGFMEIFAKYKGTLLGLSESPELLEGEWDFTRTVLISFPTREDALAWFNSPEYQELAKHRKQASTGPIMLIPSFE